MDGQKDSNKEFQSLHPSTVNQIMLERDIGEWQQQREEEREANLNKFTTLFEPSTPRASPASLTTPLPSLSDAREDAIASKTALFDFPRQSALPRSSLQRSRPSSLSSSSGSEFGAFVTTSEDPLSFTPIQDGFIQGSTTTTTADELTFLTGSNSTFCIIQRFDLCNPSIISPTNLIAGHDFLCLLRDPTPSLVKFPKVGFKYDP